MDGSCNGNRSDDHQSVKFMESELHTVDTHVLVLGRAYFFLIKFFKKKSPSGVLPDGDVLLVNAVSELYVQVASVSVDIRNLVFVHVGCNKVVRHGEGDESYQDRDELFDVIDDEFVVIQFFKLQFVYDFVCDDMEFFEYSGLFRRDERFAIFCENLVAYIFTIGRTVIFSVVKLYTCQFAAFFVSVLDVANRVIYLKGDIVAFFVSVSGPVTDGESGENRIGKFVVFDAVLV